MKATDHYKEGETALATINKGLWSKERPEPLRGFGTETLLAIAQAHFTAALAGVLALTAPQMPDADGRRWLYLVSEDAELRRRPKQDPMDHDTHDVPDPDCPWCPS